MALKLDENNIWTGAINEKIFYPEGASDACFAVEDKSFWFKHRNEVIGNIIGRFPFDGDFVDIGGGNGYQLQYLAGKMSEKKFILVEPMYSACLNARKRGIKFVYNTTMKGFPFDKFDIGGVGLFDVIEHLENDGTYLRELALRLKKGSIIYITVPAYGWLWSANDDQGGHYKRYNKRTLIRLADQCNCNILYGGHLFFYLPPVILLLRTLPYIIGCKKNIINRRPCANLHETHVVASKMLSVLNVIEMLLLKKRIAKFGSSCIAVFQV